MSQASPARAIAIPAPVVFDVGALAWPALCACAAIAAIVPLWIGRFLPYQDAPQHIAAIRVLADYHTPGFAFEKWFEIDLVRSQYLGFYLPAAILARVWGPEAACRLVLSAIALALPAATWLLLRSFGRDVRLAVLSPALFHTAPLYLGFFNFVESIPATIFVIALVERELHSPRAARAALLAIAAVVLQLGYDAKLASAYRSFEVEAEGAQLEQILQRAEPGKRVLALVHERQSRVVQFQAYKHFGMYYQVERGGRVRRNFAELPWTPVRLRADTPVVPLPPGFGEHPEWFDAQREGADEDYLLVRGGSDAPGAPFVLKAHAGQWALYQAAR